ANSATGHDPRRLGEVRISEPAPTDRSNKADGKAIDESSPTSLWDGLSGLRGPRSDRLAGFRPHRFAHGGSPCEAAGRMEHSGVAEAPGTLLNFFTSQPPWPTAPLSRQVRYVRP